MHEELQHNSSTGEQKVRLTIDFISDSENCYLYCDSENNAFLSTTKFYHKKRTENILLLSVELYTYTLDVITWQKTNDPGKMPGRIRKFTDYGPNTGFYGPHVDQ